mgnify:CR=1 FL=1
MAESPIDKYLRAGSIEQSSWRSVVLFGKNTASYKFALAPGGVFYLSFKLGNHDGMRNGRWSTDLDESAFRDLIADVPELRINRIDVTGDVRSGRSDEKWLNAWCVRA